MAKGAVKGRKIARENYVKLVILGQRLLTTIKKANLIIDHNAIIALALLKRGYLDGQRQAIKRKINVIDAGTRANTRNNSMSII